MVKIALITGGAQGIGFGLVRHFLEKNWRVAALDVDEEALSEMTGLFPQASLVPLKADAGKEENVAAAFQELGEWQAKAKEAPGFDLLVNNAGIANAACGSLETLSLADWSRVMDSHLTAAFLCSRASVPGLRLRRGAIVNMGSTRAFQSEPNWEAYAAAKGGILALTHALALSLGPDIRVNAVCPGWIETGPMQKQSRRRPVEHREVDKAQHPVGRVGEVSDIAAMVDFLAGPDAGFITGQSFVVDGGMTRKMIYEP